MLNYSAGHDKNARRGVKIKMTAWNKKLSEHFAITEYRKFFHRYILYICEKIYDIYKFFYIYILTLGHHDKSNKSQIALEALCRAREIGK